MRKTLLIVLGITLSLLTVFAVITKLGIIPNYLGIPILCSEEQPNTDPNSPPLIPGMPQDVIYKPVIYLYPTQKENVSVNINYEGNLFVTYPTYDNGWKVTAYPDGKIVNSKDNREYSYLFWEGIETEIFEYDMTTGYVIKGEDTLTFLQNKLEEIGLLPNEYNEFIVYWLPKMINNKYNLIHFATDEEYANRISLDIIPTPDSVLRVFMVFKDIEEYIPIEPQDIKSFERNGFTVVEWGGTER